MLSTSVEIVADTPAMVLLAGGSHCLSGCMDSGLVLRFRWRWCHRRSALHPVLGCGQLLDGAGHKKRGACVMCRHSGKLVLIHERAEPDKSCVYSRDDDLIRLDLHGIGDRGSAPHAAHGHPTTDSAATERFWCSSVWVGAGLVILLGKNAAYL